MGKYDFFESLQRHTTRDIHITVENYLSNLKNTEKNEKSGKNIILGATRIAYMLGLISKDTASHYHYDAIYKKVEYEISPFGYYEEKYEKIAALSIKEAKALPATKAKEMIETYILFLLDVMKKINTTENFYYVIDGVTKFAVFLQLFDYNEAAKYCAEAYVKDGTNFRGF